jgi:hypothetical protein
MVANHKVIVSEFNGLCKDLMRFATGANPGMSAFQMEMTIFRRILEIGMVAMKAFLTTQAGLYHWSTARHPDGDDLAYSGERPGTYYSIFGEIIFFRSYYCGRGKGFCPMDGALNIAPKGFSDFVRKMHEELAVQTSYEWATAFLAKYFPLSTSTRAVQEAVLSDSLDAGAYYEQAPAPPICAMATILAVEADGKGVPMIKASSIAEPEPGQLKGSPRRDGKKKEATVVSVSTHAPFVRTPEQVVASLFKDTDKDAKNNGDSCGDAREKPVSKRVWATLKGKEPALLQARVWTTQVDNDYIKYRLALTDGQPALQNRTDETFEDYVRILDLLHALQYLWKASDAQFGMKSSKGREWVRSRALLMLQGKTQNIIDELEDWATQTDNPAKYGPLEKSANYFDKNLERMRYDEYLAKGWPIATGIIEGACRHVVKDRCEGSGMRWTEQGAEAILHLRCIHQNGDWDAYHQFRMKARQEHFYAVTNRAQTVLPESNVYRLQGRIKLAEAI